MHVRQDINSVAHGYGYVVVARHTVHRQGKVTVVAAARTIGRRRRAAAIASLSRVWAFSRTRSASICASNRSRSTIVGAAMPSLLMSVIVFSSSVLRTARLLGFPGEDTWVPPRQRI